MNTNMSTANLPLSKIRLFTAVASLMLSLIAIYTDDIINADGILYLDLAATFLLDGLSGTIELYDWPFFSILIALLHKLTHIPLELCANIINGLLFILLTDALILISHKLNPSTNELFISAVFILCFTTLFEYREFIIRDVGYWAFCSMALYRFLLFMETPNIRHASGWQVLIIFAILFRIEGIVILLGLPLFVFAKQPLKNAAEQYIQLNYLVAIIFITILSLAVGQSGGVLAAFGKITTITEYVNTTRIFDAYEQKTQIFGSKILNQYSDDYSGMILISGLLFMLLYKLANSLTLGYIIVFITAIWKRQTLGKTPYQSLVSYFVALNMLILVTFLLLQYFMSTRYMMMTSIGLLLLMLPRLAAITNQAISTKDKPLMSVIILILIFNLADAMTKSNSKEYIKNTAIWASQNLPVNSNVTTNDKFINYYFNKHQPKTKLTLTDDIKSYQDYNYLIVVTKRKKLKYIAIPDSQAVPIYTLSNKRNDSATVYKILNN